MARLEPQTAVLSDGRALTVRTAVTDDAAALIDHLERVRGTSTYLVMQPDEDMPTDAEEREIITKSLESPVKLLLVGQLAPERIVAVLGFHGHERRRIAHHGDFGVGVDRDLRGLGIGRLLITTLLDWAASHETLEKVSLGVMDSNRRARKLYRSLGFVKESRQRRHFKLAQGKYADNIVMSQYVKAGVAPDGFNTCASGALDSEEAVSKDPP